MSVSTHAPPVQPARPIPLTSLVGREQAIAAIRDLLLRGGVRLLDGLGDAPIELETARVLVSPSVTHLRFNVLKRGAGGRS
jgi:hypothetical protein